LLNSSLLQGYDEGLLPS